ncbi:MAG: sigma-70 family RNA polymerase sigma factor, partial [Pirellulales bacterium]|nr:sigma-70 family RNA polymerase sigma factor [Pirellulales bacterium]
SYWERYYKTGRRDIGREIETKPEIIDGLCEQRDSMADRESAKELAEAIELVLRCLNERDAGIFSALYDEHILTLEIAERFSCSVATVNRVLTRIENRICFLLKRDDD